MSDNLIDQTLGAYRIEAQIGTGRWGAIYRAAQQSMNRTVALQTMTGDVAQFQTLDGRAAYDGHAAAVRGATIIELPAEAGASVLLPTAGLDKYLLLGKTNQTYSLEVSTNLRDWVETARTVTDASGWAQFSDSSGGSGMMKFYRAKMTTP